MANVRIYLDTRRVRQNGEYPIKIVVNHVKDIMLSTGHTASKSQFEKGYFAKSVSNYKAKNASLHNTVVRIERVLLDLERDGRLRQMSDANLKSILTKEEKSADSAFFAAFSDFIATRQARSTKEIYAYTLSQVEKYDPSASFETINRDWLERFSARLRETMGTNSISIRLRNIRAVFNYAIDNEITTAYPFRKFKIKSEKTRHRNLELTELRRILNYSGRFELFRDFFLLSFYLIGINMQDLCMLKKENYKRGRISYRRLKTKQLYDVKVEPEAKALIEKYAGSDDYLLSFINLYKDYDGFKRGTNQALKKLSDEEGVINDRLTSYYARHSWATIAASLDIPKETISAALGHRIGSDITSIYINFDQKKIDDANRRVIDLVGSGV